MAEIPITINRADVLGRQLGEALREIGVAATDEQAIAAVKLLSRQTSPDVTLWRGAAYDLVRTPSEQQAVRKAIREGKEHG
jgi:hypothetical protein